MARYDNQIHKKADEMSLIEWCVWNDTILRINYHYTDHVRKPLTMNDDLLLFSKGLRPIIKMFMNTKDAKNIKINLSYTILSTEFC